MRARGAGGMRVRGAGCEGEERQKRGAGLGEMVRKEGRGGRRRGSEELSGGEAGVEGRGGGGRREEAGRQRIQYLGRRAVKENEERRVKME
jgi:hypothetical protein